MRSSQSTQSLTSFNNSGSSPQASVTYTRRTVDGWASAISTTFITRSSSGGLRGMVSLYL